MFPNSIEETSAHTFLSMQEISISAKTGTGLIFESRFHHRFHQRAQAADLLPSPKYSDRCVHGEGDSDGLVWVSDDPLTVDSHTLEHTYIYNPDGI